MQMRAARSVSAHLERVAPALHTAASGHVRSRERNTAKYKTLFFPSLGLTLLLASHAKAVEDRLNADKAARRDTPPMDQFAVNRPRLFLSAATLPAVTERARRLHGELLNRLEAHVHTLNASTNRTPADLGVAAAAAAFLFLNDRTDDRLNAATALLERSVRYYRTCDRENRVVNHYSTTRIHAITAYDWLYDAMSQEMRARLGLELLAHVTYRVLARRVAGDNLSDYRSGFYGELCLPWYAGIATLGSGLDEAKSAAAITFGYDQQIRMFEHRWRLAGDDGGGATATLGYALRADPWAEFNFFHTMKSAFGLDIAGDWPHVALLPNYVLWNQLPGNLEFGAGDAFHLSNRFPDEHLYSHLAQIRHFYGRSHPTQAALAAWLQTRCTHCTYHPAWPLMPLLLTNIDEAPPPLELPRDSLPLARHFSGLGQIFMRSGWGESDTYALFTGGGASERHKHFDENSFVIFHKGFLALDSGTRPARGGHLFQYYCRTVAHNGILIRMEGEAMPPYWGEPAPYEPALPIANDGGMRSVTGAVIRAFHTTPNYTYIASDATACYHPDKCRLALRQFVHVQPDLFVVFDRIRTVTPQQRVAWLLHTAHEPAIEQDRIRADHREGRLWCKRFLPSEATVIKIGGPGKEFWNDGRNWPLPPPVYLGVDKIEYPDLLGGWRLEVSPAEPATDVFFLHLIEAGEARTKIEMSPARYVAKSDWTGVEIEPGGRRITVFFPMTGEPGCEIRIEGAGRTLLESLSNTVQPQSEWLAGENAAHFFHASSSR